MAWHGPDYQYSSAFHPIRGRRRRQPEAPINLRSTGGDVDMDAPVFEMDDPELSSFGNAPSDAPAPVVRRGPSMLSRLTIGIVPTYSRCSSEFRFEASLQPRRCLTKNNVPGGNDGRDNNEGDFILHARDVLGAVSGRKFQVLDLLGKGTFGQVVKCVNVETNDIVAVKVVKNKAAYFNQGLVEIQILELLNHQYDPDNSSHIVRLLDYFVFKNHLCLVFELLSVNLFELLKQNQYKGLPMTLLRCFLVLILDSLCVLHEAGVIHCDLKPENVLLENLGTPAVKLIDFGSACMRDRTVYSYIQSRFYRCPEVMLGCPYDMAIDMWSLGCIAAELFIGLPLFPGTSEHNQLRCITDMLGPPPEGMLRTGTKISRHFNVTGPGAVPRTGPDGGVTCSSMDGRVNWILKSEQQFCAETRAQLKPSKKYFKYSTLPEIIEKYQMRPNLTPAQVEEEMQSRRSFTHFLFGVLNFDKDERWTPYQARRHPFLTGEPFLGDWVAPDRESVLPAEPRVPRVIPWGIQPVDPSSVPSADLPLSSMSPAGLVTGAGYWQNQQFSGPSSSQPFNQQRGAIRGNVGSVPSSSTFGAQGYAPPAYSASSGIPAQQIGFQVGGQQQFAVQQHPSGGAQQQGAQYHQQLAQLQVASSQVVAPPQALQPNQRAQQTGETARRRSKSDAPPVASAGPARRTRRLTTYARGNPSDNS